MLRRSLPSLIFHAASTSCHSSAANRNAGETDFPARMRVSVWSSARRRKRSPCGCSTITSSSGSRPWCRPSLRSCARQAARMARQQQLQHFLEQARRGHVLDQVREFADRRARLRVDAEAELGGEAHRAQHAHRVLAKTQGRIADDAHGLLAHVGEAAVVVEHGFVVRVVVQRVGGEIAPRRVLHPRAVDVVAQQPAVLVGFPAFAGAEGGHLDRLRAEQHVHQLEAPADQVRAPEQAVHLVRVRIGGDVEVLGNDAEQQVAHRAADDVAGVIVRAQDLAHLERAMADGTAGDAVLVAPVDPGLRFCAHVEHAADEFLDQSAKLNGLERDLPAGSSLHG